MTRVWAWLKCRCTCIEADTIELTMEPYNGTVPRATKSEFAGRAYKPETSDVVAARKTLAHKYMEEGLSHGFAWRKAFEQYPHIFLDEAPVSSSAPVDDGVPGEDFFKPRV